MENTINKYSRKPNKKYRVDDQNTENLLEYEKEGRYTVIHNSILDDELFEYWKGDLEQLKEAENHWFEQRMQLQDDPEYWESQLELYSDVLTDKQVEIVEDLANKKDKPLNNFRQNDNTKMFMVQIASEVVRDNTVNDAEFVLYAKLVQLYQRSGKKDEYEVDYRQLMYFLDIGDNRTLKKCLNKLFNRGLILNEIRNLPKKQPLKIKINPEYIPSKDKSIKFTQLPHVILDLYIIKNIAYTGIRILYYLESYIDRSKQYDIEQVAYPSEELIGKDTGNSRTTIVKYIQILEKEKLIKIERNYLHPKADDGYIDDDVQLFIKYNNKYWVRRDNFKKRAEKWKRKTLDL